MTQYKSKTQNYIRKFNSLELAKEYAKNLGYSLKYSNNFKEDRSFIYQDSKVSARTIYIKSTWDYLDNNSLDMGTVWTVQRFYRNTLMDV